MAYLFVRYLSYQETEYTYFLTMHLIVAFHQAKYTPPSHSPYQPKSAAAEDYPVVSIWSLDTKLWNLKESVCDFR